MYGWEGWVIALSLCVIAIGMLIGIVALILTLTALRRLIVDAHTKMHSFKRHDDDPINELINSVQDIFDKKNEHVSEKAASALKCALLGLTIWQQYRRRR